MAFAIGGHGKTQFGIQTQFFLSKLKNVEGVICAGAAGGIKPGMRPGDVVAALRTIEHDYRFRFVPKPVPQFESCPDMLERLRALNFNDPAFDLHFAAVASGDEDVVEPTRAREIHESTGAWAVAWEGAGSARACRFNQVPHLELRGLTDSADASALADFEKNLLRAMENVGQVLLSLSLVER